MTQTTMKSVLKFQKSTILYLVRGWKKSKSKHFDSVCYVLPLFNLL